MPTLVANQWNIGGVGSSDVGHVYFMYISCIFHVVCATFSALAMQKLADTNPVSSGIWALVIQANVVITINGYFDMKMSYIDTALAVKLA